MNVQSPKEKSMFEAEALLVKNGFGLESCDKQGVDFLACRPIMVQFRTRLGVYKEKRQSRIVYVLSGQGSWGFAPLVFDTSRRVARNRR